MTRTEDDLRDALRSLEQYAPSADDVLRAVAARTGGAAGGPAFAWGATRYRRLLVVAVATAAAAAVAAAAVLVSGQIAGGQLASGTVAGGKVARHQAAGGTVAGGHVLGGQVAGRQAGGRGQVRPWLRARLLAAISGARSDILVTHWPGVVEETEWAWPWYPRPGQGVRVRVQEFFPSGQEVKDLVYVFTMPRHPVSHFPGPITWGTMTVPGTYTVINHLRRTWGTWHHVRFGVALPLDPAAIQREITSGKLSVIGAATYAGRQAVKLGIALPVRHSSAVYATRATLWVDATSYLPLHQLVRLSDGERFRADYAFLPPTGANLAVLHPVIPAGYRYWTTQDTGRRPKT